MWYERVRNSVSISTDTRMTGIDAGKKEPSAVSTRVISLKTKLNNLSAVGLINSFRKQV